MESLKILVSEAKDKVVSKMTASDGKYTFRVFVKNSGKKSTNITLNGGTAVSQSPDLLHKDVSKAGGKIITTAAKRANDSAELASILNKVSTSKKWVAA